MARPSPAEVLRFIAENESFERTLAAYPDLSLQDLRELLHAVARAASRRESQALGLDTTRLRIFCDGAARGNPGPAGAGAVLYTADGRLVERLGRYLGHKTNNHAEYQGLLLGLQRAVELGAREVEVYADSELLVRQLRGEYRVRSKGLLPLWQRARELLGRFDRVRLAHVPREKNREADEMSNRAIDERL